MTAPRPARSWAVVCGGWALAYLALPIWLRGTSAAHNLVWLVGLVATFVVAALVLNALRLPALPAFPRPPAERPSLLPRAWPLIVLPWLALQVAAQWGHALELGYGDEELHAGVPARLFNLLTWHGSLDTALLWRVGLWVLIVAAALLAWRARSYGASAERPRRGVLVGALLLAGLALYYVATQALFRGLGDSGADLYRYPPLDPALRLLAMLLLGPNELALRLPGLAFALVAAWYTYRLLAEAIHEHAGVLGAVMLLFLPVFMHWSLQVYLVSGQAAFGAAIVYYLSRHLRDGDPGDAAWAFFLAGLAVLYERMMLVVAPLLFISLLVWRIWGKGALPLRLRDYLKLLALSLATMLPWLAITKKLGVRPPLICPHNWLHPSLVLAYPLRGVSDLTPLLALLVAVGIVLTLSRRRSWAGVFVLLWWGVLYGIYTSDALEWIPTSRFLLVLAPGWVMLAVQAVNWLARNKDSARTWRVGTILTAAWLLTNWLWPLQVLPHAGQDITCWRQVNQPIDAAFADLKNQNALSGQNALDLTYCSTAPFYCAKYRLRPAKLVRYSWYEHRGHYFASGQDVAQLAHEGNCSIVFFANPACLEPYEGAAAANAFLASLGQAPDRNLFPLTRQSSSHGSYYAFRLIVRQ